MLVLLEVPRLYPELTLHARGDYRRRMRTGSLALVFVAAVLAAYWLGQQRVVVHETIAAAPSPRVETTAPIPSDRQQSPPATPSPTTIADILRLPGDFAQTAALYTLAARTDEPTLVRLIDEALAIEQLTERDAASSILYTRYTDLDAPAAVDHAFEHAGSSADAAIIAIFHTWARRDLETAADRVKSLSPPLHDVAALALLRARDDLDSRDRRRIAAELGVDESFTALLTAETAQRWAGDPRGAWNATLALADSSSRWQQMLAVAGTWAKEDPQSALAAARDLDDNWRQPLVHSVLSVWANTDPERALDELLTEPPSSERNDVALSFLAGWSYNNPQLAAAWFEQQRDKELRANLVAQAAEGYALKDMEAAIDWARGLPANERVDAVATVAGILVQKDPERAAALVLEQNDANATKRLVMSWAQSDPAAVSPWITANIDDPKMRLQMLELAVMFWTGTDEAAVVRFVETLRPGLEYDRTAMTVISGVNDPSLAARLLDKMRNPVLKRQAQDIVDNRSKS